MSAPTIVDFPEKEVLYVEAIEFPGGVPKAFQELENHFASLRGLKFYGVFFSNETAPKYWACVDRATVDLPDDRSLSSGRLPAGRCARAKIVGWSEARDLGQLIRKTFETLRTQFEADPERPSIEF